MLVSMHTAPDLRRGVHTIVGINSEEFRRVFRMTGKSVMKEFSGMLSEESEIPLTVLSARATPH